MDEKLRETTNLCVRQAKGKIGHVVQIRVCRLTKTGSLYFDLRKRVFKLLYLSPSCTTPISLAVLFLCVVFTKYWNAWNSLYYRGNF